MALELYIVTNDKCGYYTKLLLLTPNVIMMHLHNIFMQHNILKYI